MDNPAFKDAYIKLVTRAWSDDRYRQSVLQDPVRTLREAGFDVPENGVVRIDQSDYSTYEEPSLDEAAQVWNRGHADGVFRLSIPPAAPVELAEIDENELKGLAGGVCCSCCCN